MPGPPARPTSDGRPSPGGRRRSRRSHAAYLAQLRTRPCGYCGETPGGTVDHVIPASRGGTAHHLNVVPSCATCNGEKGNQTGIEWAIVLARVGDYGRAQRALAAQSRAERLTRRDTARTAGA